MRRLFPPLALLLVAALAHAGSYTITTTTAQDNRLSRHLTRVNRATCASVGLPASCTQAQARAINPTLDVYTNVADMIDRLVLAGFLNGLKANDTTDDAEQFCAWFKAASAASQNSACGLAGLPNGCEVCK